MVPLWVSELDSDSRLDWRGLSLRQKSFLLLATFLKIGSMNAFCYMKTILLGNVGEARKVPREQQVLPSSAWAAGASCSSHTDGKGR